MVRALGLCCVLTVILVLAGCGAKEQTMNQTSSAEPAAPEPDRVTVQHILITFQGSAAEKDVDRSEEEAGQLADELYQRAKSGEDFDALVKAYTDDNYPGIYGVVNFGVEADEVRQIYPREKMAEGFGNVAFSLQPGEIGLAAYDKKDCKFGWHVIKRLR